MICTKTGLLVFFQKLEGVRFLLQLNILEAFLKYFPIKLDRVYLYRGVSLPSLFLAEVVIVRKFNEPRYFSMFCLK